MKVPHTEEKPGPEQLGFASLENADRLRNLGSFRAAEGISGWSGSDIRVSGKDNKICVKYVESQVQVSIWIYKGD